LIKKKLQLTVQVSCLFYFLLLKLDAHGCVLCVFFGACMVLILWCRVFFGCFWYGLRSSRTSFYIDASDSLLRVQEKAVLVDNRQTHRTAPDACHVHTASVDFAKEK